MRLFLLLACLLSGTALAGGAGPVPAGELHRRAALEALPGVRVLEALPFDSSQNTTPSAAQIRAQTDYQRTHDSDYTVSVQVGDRAEKVFVSAVRPAGAPALNIVHLHLANPRPTLLQQRALVQVGLGLFNLCQPDQAQSPSSPFWHSLLTQPWGSWQEAKVGVLNVGWRGQENVPAHQDPYFVGTLDLRWPASTGRCTF